MWIGSACPDLRAEFLPVPVARGKGMREEGVGEAVVAVPLRQSGRELGTTGS
jgi:hypothetical protein